MISIQGVTFTYPGGSAPVLRDLHLEVPQGAFVAVVGNNGSGKTSLCKLLTGLIPHFFEGDFTGSVIVNGINTLEARVSELSRHVGYVYQDFENQLLKPKVLEDVAFAPLNFGMLDYQERAQATLETLDLARLGQRIIWELSGGEQHLVALAGALALEPGIIVVDEPVSQLDPVHAEMIYQKLAYLNREQGKTVLVIEHHPDFIGAYCDSVILLKEGTVTWHIPVRQALSRIEELERNDIFSPQVTRLAHRVSASNGVSAKHGVGVTHDVAAGDSAPEMTYPINLEESIAYFRPYLAGRPVSAPHSAPHSTPRPAPEKPDANPAGASRQPVVAFQQVSHHYKMLDNSQKTVLDQVDLSFYAGERIALVGANGAGKSTLMRLVCGLEKPKRGIVTVLGHDTRKRTPEELADHVALVYQHPEQMFIEDNIRQDVAYFLEARRVLGREEIVAKAIDDFRLAEIQERDGRLLSGGQMRRASLAIGACMRPKIMLLDEPTSSLDVANRRQIMWMLNRLEEWVQTVVIATHDMELVAEWASRVIVLQQGRVLADDLPEIIFGDPALVAQARVRPPQVVQLSNALGIRPVHLSVDSFVQDLTQANP